MRNFAFHKFRDMKTKLFFITFVILLCISCTQEQQPMLGLKYGQEYSDALSFLKSKKYNAIDNKEVVTVCNASDYGFNWDYVRIDFQFNQLDCVRYTSATSDTITQSQYDKFVSFFKETYPNMKVESKEDGVTQFSDELQTIDISLVKSDYSNQRTLNILFQQIPSQEELARRDNIKRSREEEIDNQLQKLNEGMIEYVKCLDHDPYNLRNHYVDQVRSADTYLRDHIEDMTPKQKEWYDRLNKVTL